MDELMATLLTISSYQEGYEAGYEAGKQAAIDQIFKDLESEVEEHSVYWAYQSRVNLLDRIVRFRKKYQEEV